MSPKDIAKHRIKRALYWGIALLVICTVPFVLCLLKSAYANRLLFFSDIAANVYRGFPTLQQLWEWPIFPAFLPANGISIGNIFAALFAIGFLFGSCALSSALGQYVRYCRLKGEADDDGLRANLRN